MAGARKKHDPALKKQVALEAIRQQKTINEITAEYGIHATQVSLWKKQATDAIEHTFMGRQSSAERDYQREIDELHRQLGQALAERDWLKKKSMRLD